MSESKILPTVEKLGTDAEEAAKIADMKQSWEKTRQTRKLQKFLMMLPGKLGMLGAFLAFMANVIPLILLIVFIIVLSVLMKKRKKKKSVIRESTKGVFGSIKNMIIRIWNMFAGIFGLVPGGALATIKKLSFSGDDVETIERPTHKNGRCDDMTYVELAGGSCLRTSKPKDYVWELDTSQLTDIPTLPDRIKDRLSTKTKVIMPYEENASYYVPQCAKAKFEDGTDATHLLEENGFSCKKKSTSQIAFPTIQTTKDLKYLSSTLSAIKSSDNLEYQ